MKCIGAGIASVLFVVVAAGWIHGHHTIKADRVVAKSFVMNDSEGNARSRLAVFPNGAGLEIYAASGESRVQLLGGGEDATLNLFLPETAVHESASVNLLHNNAVISSLRSDATGSELEMHSKTEDGSAVIDVQGTTTSLTLNGADENVPKISLTADKDKACAALSQESNSSAGSSLCLHSPGMPTLELADLKGNRAVIGIPQSPDLNTKNGSAASLILKHNSGAKVQVTPVPPPE